MSSGNGKANTAAVSNKNKLRLSLYRAMRGEDSLQLPFTERLAVVRMTGGSRIMHVYGGDREIKIPSPDDAVHIILKYCHSMAAVNDKFLIDSKEAETILSTFTKMSKPIEQPGVVGFKSTPGLVYRRVPFDPKPGLTPTWESLVDRMSNQRAFMSFIGSMFMQESHDQQYIWIYGEGGDGKGAIGRWMEKIFQNGYYSTAAVNSKFWLWDLLGKRCVIFSDWTDQAFVTRGLFKSMSGGDPQRIEGKFRDSMTVKLKCKYIFFSNERPAVTDSSSDMRRLIYCKIKPIAEDKKEHQAFEEKLWAESSAFLYECLKIYSEDCPENGPIPFCPNEALELAEENRSHWQGVFDEYFVEGGMTSAAEMANFSERRRLNRAERSEWKDFLVSKMGATYKTVRISGKPVKYYVGINLHRDWENRSIQNKVQY